MPFSVFFVQNKMLSIDQVRRLGLNFETCQIKASLTKGFLKTFNLKTHNARQVAHTCLNVIGYFSSIITLTTIF